MNHNLSDQELNETRLMFQNYIQLLKSEEDAVDLIHATDSVKDTMRAFYREKQKSLLSAGKKLKIVNN